MTWEPKVLDLRERYFQKLASEILTDFDCAVLWACESPIEQMFVGELFLLGLDVRYGDWKAERIQRVRELFGAVGSAEAFPKAMGYLDLARAGADVYWFGQCPVQADGREYRIDSAIAVDWTVKSVDAIRKEVHWYAVECDGHDYHERTKKQAASDRSRDRKLTSSNWTPVRFTGSELYANSAGCVDELFRIILSRRPAGEQ